MCHPSRTPVRRGLSAAWATRARAPRAANEFETFALRQPSPLGPLIIDRAVFHSLLSLLSSSVTHYLRDHPNRTMQPLIVEDITPPEEPPRDVQRPRPVVNVYNAPYRPVGGKEEVRVPLRTDGGLVFWVLKEALQIGR